MIKQIHSQILFAYVIISMRGTEQGDRPRCIVPLSSVMWAHGWSDSRMHLSIASMKRKARQSFDSFFPKEPRVSGPRGVASSTLHGGYSLTVVLNGSDIYPHAR